MAISLTYNSTLARVEIAVSNIPGDTVTDTFTRTVASGWGTSDSGHTWSVTSGASYSVGSGTGAIDTSTSSDNQYALLGVNYADIDITVTITYGGTGNGDAGVVCRYTDTDNLYWVALDSPDLASDTLSFYKRVGGSFTAVSQQATPFTTTSGTAYKIRVRVQGSTVQAKVWDALNTEPGTWLIDTTDTSLTGGDFGIEYLDLGSSLSLAVDDLTLTSLDVNDTYEIQRSTNQSFWRTVRGGSEMVPSSGSLSLDDYEFQSDVENFYRVVATDGGNPIFSNSITPSLSGVWLKSIRFPFLNRQVTVTNYSDITRSARGANFDVLGRSVPVAVTDKRSSQKFSLELVTTDADEELVMDLVLASGGVMFVHLPADCRVPGGHVVIGEVSSRRKNARGSRRYFTLECQVVAEPAADVVGGTMTYGALIDLYGGYDNLLSANPEYADLLQLMASPEDLVVL